MIDFSRTHFALFGLPERFRCPTEALDRAYRALQTEVHPDRFARADAATRAKAEARARAINAAYDAIVAQRQGAG